MDDSDKLFIAVMTIPLALILWLVFIIVSTAFLPVTTTGVVIMATHSYGFYEHTSIYLTRLGEDAKVITLEGYIPDPTIGSVVKIQYILHPLHFYATLMNIVEVTVTR